MRPNPLMATLIFFAWVTCFEPTVPCKIAKQERHISVQIPTRAFFSPATLGILAVYRPFGVFYD